MTIWSSETERILVETTREIGGIPEMAAWATAALALRIEATGKNVSELTLGELRQLLQRQSTLHMGLLTEQEVREQEAL